MINIEETRKAAKSSTKWAIGSIILSAVLSIAGIVYSIHLSNESSRELQETRLQLEKTINESVKENDLKLDTAMNIIKTNMETCSNIERHIKELKGKNQRKK